MRAFLIVSVVISAAMSSSCLDCRPTAARTLAVDCVTDASWRGELHLDSAATWRSFLVDRCLVGEPPEVIDEWVRAVDFTQEAVVVAKGARGSVSRCLEAREVETVDVCDSGVRVLFEDVESGEQVCPGDWTVAFALPRDDLRSALLANERASNAEPFSPGATTVDDSVAGVPEGAAAPESPEN
jgi:hypothetical protein